MSRNAVRVSLVLASVLLLPIMASAQQAVSVNVGYFAPRGEDSRIDGDVLIANQAFHIFDLGDLGNAAISGEWLFPLGDFLEGGVGVGYYSRSVPSVYREFVNENGAEIEQDFKLRIVPITASIRFLPLGREARIEPYVGAGLGIFSWRYSETGDFISPESDIFPDRFIDNGTALGPVAFGGVRVPFSSNFALGGELRYQRASGELEPDLFNDEKIDLGGFTYQAVLQFRF